MIRLPRVQALTDLTNVHYSLKLMEDHPESKKKVCYKLVTKRHSDNTKSKVAHVSSSKDITVKNVSFSHRISDNDLNTKSKLVKGWLSKPNTEVRVAVNATPDISDDALVSTIFCSVFFILK